MTVCPLFFLWDSKKYLSQKNVVEKLNANVMHGKVRKVSAEAGSQGRGFFGQMKVSPFHSSYVSWPAEGSAENLSDPLDRVKCTC